MREELFSDVVPKTGIRLCSAISVHSRLISLKESTYGHHSHLKILVQVHELRYKHDVRHPGLVTLVFHEQPWESLDECTGDVRVNGLLFTLFWVNFGFIFLRTVDAPSFPLQPQPSFSLEKL